MAAVTAVVNRINNRFFMSNNKLSIRRYMINFPSRPSISERYQNLDAIKNAKLPCQMTHKKPSMFAAISEGGFQEQTIPKGNGSFIYITEKLPEKYKRTLLSEEEIECVNFRVDSAEADLPVTTDLDALKM